MASLPFDTLPAPDSGYLNAKVRQDGAANVSFEVPSTLPPALAPVVTAPVAGQYVILYPHVATVTRQDDPTLPTYGFANGASAGGSVGMGTLCSLSYTNTVVWSDCPLDKNPVSVL